MPGLPTFGANPAARALAFCFGVLRSRVRLGWAGRALWGEGGGGADRQLYTYTNLSNCSKHIFAARPAKLLRLPGVSTPVSDERVGAAWRLKRRFVVEQTLASDRKVSVTSGRQASP